ncbi:MAG TPA: BrnT family toxin [Acidobacteriaceae bacterium]
MSSLRFEWDEAKNAANQRKHGVSFELASQAFDDPLYLSAPERIEDGEERWQTFGLVNDVLLLMVAHTIREDDTPELIETIRIITARKATPSERRRYENENRKVYI